MAEIDRYSDTWTAIEQWLLERRADRLQSLINGSAVDERLRGEIRVIDDLMDEAKGDQEPDFHPDTDY